ncbi:MAG TPA: CDP-alcohol phosphatidyltransferase family protein [Candidatus Paceibacterota bacterium]
MHEKEFKITLSDRILAATFLKLLPRRVTPNQLTIFRFFTVPFVASLMYLEYYAIAIPLFAIAAFTDALDGALARTKNKITEWGKTYDPIADKLLIGLTGIIIIPKYINFFLAVFIIFIEMFVIGTAYYLKNKGAIHISANAWGKTKMICQSFGVGLLLLYAVISVPAFLIIAQYLLYISIFLAIVSIVTYGI